jgi:segregation and condensation protein A
MPYSVKTEHFEGPLDLLLSLVEKRKLHINEVSLAQVTDDFIAYVKGVENFPIAESANFILVASILVLIKSKSLLPTLDLTIEEETNIEDLERRLKEYKRIKDLSLHIKERFGKNIIFAKLPNKNITPVFSPHERITVASLLSGVKDVLKNIPKIEAVPKAIIKKVISLEETIMSLTERIKSSLKMSFKDFSKFGKEEKVNVIVSFLAMLELVKQGIINVTQERTFDDINMETEELGIPKYN